MKYTFYRCAVLVSLIGTCVTGCSEPPPPPPPPPLPTCTQEAQLANADLEVRVSNTFPTRQWVFLDNRHLLGTVGVASTCPFRVPSGQHVLRAADSANMNDNPVERSENLHSDFEWSIFQSIVHH